MRHSIVESEGDHTEFLYEWKLNGCWNKIGATVSNKLETIQPGSPEEFIFEHYWGYNSLSSIKTMEYQVEHISWEVGKVKSYVFDADIAELYGDDFVPYLKGEPYSAFFAAGSPVGIRMGAKIQIDPVLP
jgi:hypothetical protein